MKIEKTAIGMDAEKLKSPFGFKGNYADGLWQTIAGLESGGAKELGIAVQSVLWSDASVFAEYGQDKGNQLMHDLTAFALGKLSGMDFENPFEANEWLFNKCYAEIKRMTGRQDIRKTFVLNALVPVDMAFWLLWAKSKGIGNYDEMTSGYSSYLPVRHKKIAAIPLITYGVSHDEIKKLLEEGSFFLKVKIGKEPEWDKERILEIWSLAKNYETIFSKSGRPVLYLDANGMYKDRKQLEDLLDFLEAKNILKHIGVFEEPFDELNETDVADLPCVFAIDESAHSVEDSLEKFQQGYKAVALKPVAKTLSESLRILKAATDRGIKCFTADLTVAPWQLEWNRNLAARIPSLECVDIGLLESNGNMNYIDWDKLKGYHPKGNGSWVDAKNGIFELDDFYECDGGLFEIPDYYMKQLSFG
ncbi:MAG: L-alanine-DL-glutamate epimerase [Clostridia bacterium]|nr:L-alanine-DL-glutamate epimerase [Clostridia bacterium]MBN2884210.1 L-alanine-DL-glutamate epimerase [Clostridia bacterium]